MKKTMILVIMLLSLILLFRGADNSSAQSSNYVYRVNPTGYVCGTTGQSPNIVNMRFVPDDNNQDIQVRVEKCAGGAFSQSGRVYLTVNGVRRWGPIYYSSGTSRISFDIDPVSMGITGSNNYLAEVLSNDQPNIPKHTGTITAWEEYTGPDLRTRYETIQETRTFYPGSTIYVRSQVRSYDESAGASHLGFWISSSDDGNPINSNYKSTNPIQALSEGESSPYSYEDVGIPLGLSPGTYYVVFEADTNHAISENDEGNNRDSRSFTIAACSSGTLFCDVPSDHALRDEIEALYNNNITSGCRSGATPDNNLPFCPDARFERWMAAVFLLRTKHGTNYQPPNATTQVFNDVPLSHPSVDWINQLYNEGITTGCNVGSGFNFCPDYDTSGDNGILNRGDLAVFLARALGWDLNFPMSNVFIDVTENGTREHAIEYMWWTGYTNGDPDCTSGENVGFCPNKKLDRAHAAGLISRAAGFVNTSPRCASLAVNTNPLGTGNVTRNPSSPDCPIDGSKYKFNTPITLTANPNSGYHFDSWSGYASGTNNPTTITLDRQNRSVTANFITTPPPPPPSGEQLLQNTSFESGDDPSPWQWIGPCNRAVYNDSAIAYEGNRYLATNKGNNSSCSSFYQDIERVPVAGETYHFGIWARSSNGTPRNSEVVIWAQGGQQEKGNTFFTVDSTNWQYFSTSLTVQGNDHTSLRAEVYLHSSEEIDYYFDSAGLYGPPRYSISGNVTDSNGNPFSGVQIEVIGPAQTQVNHAYTDNNGNYVLDDLVEGTYLAGASYDSNPNFIPSEIWIDLGPNATQDFQAEFSVDNTNPTVNITSPTPDSNIGLNVNITANAQDNLGGSGINRVEFYVSYDGDSHNLGSDNSAPYTMLWEAPTELRSQKIRFEAYAVDNAGNHSSSDSIAIFYESEENPDVQVNWVSNRAYLNQRSLGTFGDAMCSMASIAMVRAQAGLIGSDFNSLRDEANQVWDTGLRGPSPEQVRDYLNDHGMTAEVIWDQNKNRHWNRIKQEIDANRPVILNGYGSQGNLTYLGHYIVIVGYREPLDPQQREIIVYDPFGEWSGTISVYNQNSTSPNSPDGTVGLWKSYRFNNLGTIYSIIAQPQTLNLTRSIPTSPPEQIFVREYEDIVIYEGHGQDQVLLALSPPTVNVGMGQTFDVAIEVMTGEESVDGAAGYLNFDPALLQVVSVTGSDAFQFDLVNQFDNSTGHVDFAAGSFSNLPSGTFTLATVTMQAVAQTDGSTIEFNMSSPRLSDATSGGGSILNGTIPSTVIVSNAIIDASVTLQGRPAPPHSRWVVPLRVSFTVPGESTPAYTFTPMTDENGHFTLTGIEAGTYEVRVKHAHTLQNVQTVTLGAGSNTVDLGILREGDANDDNFITIIDFSILAATFGVCEGDDGYDERADFNGDGCITIIDFSLLASNFGQSGQSAPMTPNRGSEVSLSEVTIEIEPAQTDIEPGDVFHVTVRLDADEQAVDGAQVVLNFDPEMLEVVAVSGGEQLPQGLQNEVDGESGTLRFAAGALEGFPTGRIEVLEVEFKALAPTDGTSLSFAEGTEVTFGGASVLGEQAGGTIVISEPTAVTVQELGKREALPLPVSILAAIGLTILAGALISRRRG